MCKKRFYESGIFLGQTEGIIRIGGKVKFKDSRYGEEKEFTVSNIVYTIDMETFHSNITCTYFVELEEITGKRFLLDDLYPLLTNYNVYKWKKYYILAESPEKALKVWNSMIDELLLISNCKPKIYKIIKNLNEIQEGAFPICTNMKHEYQFPCIVKNLNWEEKPVYVYYQNP